MNVPKLPLKTLAIAAVAVFAGTISYKTLIKNPQILIECSNEETFIYRPNKNEMLFVRIGNFIYNEEMLATEIDEIVYAQMGNDTMGRASFTFNRKTKKLLANFNKKGASGLLAPMASRIGPYPPILMLA